MANIGLKHGLAGALLLVGLAAAGPASAQPAPGLLVVAPFEPAAILPLQEPVPLGVGNVPAFRFAIEFLNLGVPLPQMPGRVLIEGGGTVVRGVRMAGWDIAIDRATVESQVLQATMPLATVSTDVGDDSTVPRIYRAEYPGLDTLTQAPPRSPIRHVIRSLVDTLAWSLAAVPRQAVTAGSPAIDIGETLRRYLASALPDAQLVQPPSPGIAQGIVERLGRSAVLVRQESPFVVRAAYRDARMQTQAVAAIDVATGLPLYVQARVFGPVDLPLVRGPVDFTMRVAVSLEQMGDPAGMLAPPQMVAIAPPPAPPPETVPAATRPRPAAKPTPAEPAVAAPKPPPAKEPAAPAKPAAPAAAGSEITRRLEQLKSIYERGLITKEQYEAKREAILKEL